MFTYLLFVLPAIALGLYAQWLVKKTFARYTEVPSSAGVPGAEVARRILERQGLADVEVLPSSGELSDHYDPRKRTVNLSPDVYEGTSVSSTAVAAHEVGHALQHAQAWTPMQIRSAIAPVVGFASNTWFLLLFAGFILGAVGLIKVAIVVYAAVVVFQLVTLPVEFNASSRAKTQLGELGLVGASGGEIEGTRKVLRSAALTYVAAALASLLTLLYYVGLVRD
jgi:Zn-dependent membrane protease YugP